MGVCGEKRRKRRRDQKERMSETRSNQEHGSGQHGLQRSSAGFHLNSHLSYKTASGSTFRANLSSHPLAPLSPTRCVRSK